MYEIDGITKIDEIKVDTPFGAPSNKYTIAKVDGVDNVEVAFLPRHGQGHIVTPTEINYQANVYGMKKLGVSFALSVTAVGSLQMEYVPGQMVLVNQFIDRTKDRKATFFGNGIVSHVPFGEPICGTTREYLRQACEETGAIHHADGEHTLVCIEGPAFSTIAESNLYRSWGASVVGMTNVTEAKLAREAEISLATLAMVTDYDCWHPNHDSVTVEQVVATASANVSTAKEIVKVFVKNVATHDGPAPMSSCMTGACMTAPDSIPKPRLNQLEELVGRYL
jgi:5'-methylthioadenosine phosphorylase